MNRKDLEELINDIKEQVKTLSWYTDDVYMQRVALRRLDFIVNVAIMELDNSTEEGKQANE